MNKRCSLSKETARTIKIDPKNIHLFFFYNKKVTCDTWHMTFDTQIAGVIKHCIVSKMLVPNSNGLGTTMFWRYFHKGIIGILITERINYDDVYIVARVTLCLLNTYMGRFCMTQKWPNPGLFNSNFGRSLWLSGLVNRVQINSYLTVSTLLLALVNL